MALSSRSNRTSFWFVTLFLVVPVAIPHLIPRTSGPTTFQRVGPGAAAKSPDRGREVAPMPRPAAD